MAKPSSTPGIDARTPLRRAAQELLAARLADLRALEGAARTLDADAIHNLRVATRRLRAALEAFCEADADEVQSLGKALGAVRDLQVELEWLETRASDAAERERVGRAMRQRLVREGGHLETALGRWSERDVAKVLRAFGGARASGRLGGSWAAARLERSLGALKPGLKALRAGISPEETHALRKRVKKLKYEAELFQAAHPRAVKKWTGALSALQAQLGDTHDADLRCSWLDHNHAASPRLRDLAHIERENFTATLAREIENWHETKRLAALRRALWG